MSGDSPIPTRTVAVIWEPLEDVTILEDSEALIEIRRRWGRDYLDEQLQDAGGYQWERASFAGGDWPQLAGFWANEAYGGPFRTIFLQDPDRKRLYGINWLCYAPNMRKHLFMREAYAVAETFRLRP